MIKVYLQLMLYLENNFHPLQRLLQRSRPSCSGCMITTQTMMQTIATLAPGQGSPNTQTLTTGMYRCGKKNVFCHFFHGVRNFHNKSL